jgi:hypothetical protein
MAKKNKLTQPTTTAIAVEPVLAAAPVMPKIESIQILGKFSDGKIRQLITTKDEGEWVLSLLQQTSKNGTIKCLEEPLYAISWDERCS